MKSVECMVDDGEARPIAPEVRLFRHIIMNAVLDAIYGASWEPHRTGQVKAEAFNWFTNAGPDFEMICECACMNPTVVRKKALAFIIAQRNSPETGRPTLHHTVGAGVARLAA